MKNLPHSYHVNVTGAKTDNLLVTADQLAPITVAPPAEFDGPGDQWSPESLLLASVSSCLVLSFRAISKASSLNWLAIECQSEGELDKVDRKILFTRVTTKAKLTLAAGESEQKAITLLTKAEQTCFISNSLSAQSELECEIVFAE